MMNRLLLAAAVLVLPVARAMVVQCPDPFRIGTTFDCSSRQIAGVPTGIPTETTILYLYENAITSIDAAAFSNLTYLTILDFSLNQISFISSGAFAGLTFLTDLFLSQNPITTILAGTFTGLDRLNQLSLAKTNLSSIDNGGLTGMPALMLLLLDGIAATRDCVPAAWPLLELPSTTQIQYGLCCNIMTVAGLVPRCPDPTLATTPAATTPAATTPRAPQAPVTLYSSSLQTVAGTGNWSQVRPIPASTLWMWGVPSAANHPRDRAVLGTVISGPGLYPDTITTPGFAVSPTIAVAGFTSLRLGFSRYLGIAADDVASILVCPTGRTCRSLWTNGGVAVNDTRWISVSYAIPSSLVTADSIKIRFGLGPTRPGAAGATVGPGWSVTNFRLTGVPVPAAGPSIAPPVDTAGKASP